MANSKNASVTSNQINFKSYHDVEEIEDEED